MKQQIVGVIFSRADLRRALRMRKPPDLFELRLDALAGCIHEVKSAIPRLGRSLIITARHPREGGSGRLSAPQRRALLLEFLTCAQFVDIELRSADLFLPILRAPRHRQPVRKIISFHDFERTPPLSHLETVITAARSLGADIVKIAVRTDTAAHLDTLFDFFDRHRSRMKLVAMGIGKRGRLSRVELARRGCLLNYAHLGAPVASGQLSVEELRRVLSRR